MMIYKKIESVWYILLKISILTGAHAL